MFTHFHQIHLASPNSFTLLDLFAFSMFLIVRRQRLELFTSRYNFTKFCLQKLSSTRDFPDNISHNNISRLRSIRTPATK